MIDTHAGTAACRSEDSAATTSAAFRPSEQVRLLRPYKGTQQIPLFLPHRERVAKLDWNESVHPPSPAVRSALADCVLHTELNWYPDVDAVALRTALEEYTGVGMEWIRAFGGSDAALEYVARAFLNPGDTVLWVPPTYDNVRVYVESCGGRLKAARPKSIWRGDPRAISDAVTRDVRLVYLVNPNNPTGALYTLEQIDDLLRAHPNVAFLIDEAYFEFCGVTAAPFLHAHRNLMIARSFSKAFGLAGLRIGYLMSHPDNLDWIDRIRVGKNTTLLAQVAAIAALGDRGHLLRVIEETRTTMSELAARLEKMGLEVRTTPANFLLVRVHDPDMVTRALANHLIFVRNRNHEPALEGWLRVTVGTPALIERVAGAFSALPPALLYGREAPLHPMRLERPPEAAGSEDAISGGPKTRPRVVASHRTGRPVATVSAGRNGRSS